MAQELTTTLREGFGDIRGALQSTRTSLRGVLSERVPLLERLPEVGAATMGITAEGGLLERIKTTGIMASLRERVPLLGGAAAPPTKEPAAPPARVAGEPTERIAGITPEEEKAKPAKRRIAGISS